MEESKQILSSDYRRAALFSLTLQFAIAVVCLMLLDGGVMAKGCGAAILLFWVVAGLVALRRPASPTTGVLWFWKWGFLPIWIVSAILFYLAYYG